MLANDTNCSSIPILLTEICCVSSGFNLIKSIIRGNAGGICAEGEILQMLMYELASPHLVNLGWSVQLPAVCINVHLACLRFFCSDLSA